MELHVYLSWCYIVLSVCFSVTVSTDVTCENRNCLNNKCSGDGGCLSGCREGFVSDNKGQCLEPCSHNCAKCEKGVCTKCQPGYYGPRCMKLCDGCNNDSCDTGTGQCKTGCKDGNYTVPWCNSTTLSDGHTHHQNAELTKLQDDEESSRKVYIWIAGAVIVSVILAVVIIIIVAVRGREKDMKSSYDIPASEHLTARNEETTEIV